MKIISYSEGGAPHLGVVTGDDLFAPVEDVAPRLPSTLRSLLTLPNGLGMLREAAKGARGTRKLADVHLLPVVPEPNVTWALALNFKTHIEETGLVTSKEYPHLFIRHSASL